MAIERKLNRIETPQGQPGFLGAGHIARPVVTGDFSQTDPFIFLMDDLLDKQDYDGIEAKVRDTVQLIKTIRKK